MLPQVLLTGTEHFLWPRLSEGAQSTADLLLHRRVLVRDSIQQGEGQLCNDKTQSVCSSLRGLPDTPYSPILQLTPISL
jgi:hypothetical protein